MHFKVRIVDMNDNTFNPKISFTAGMMAAIEDIERQIWLVDHMLLMPKHEAWIRREVQVQRAVGTTVIEGATLDDSAVRSLIREGGGRSPTEDEKANTNALQAYSFIDFLSDQPEIPIDELVIRQLNRFFMTGAPETFTAGVYRKGQQRIRNFMPPNQGDVPGLMRSLTLWLQQEDDETHPIAKAGMAHIQLAAIHPFWGCNGRTARAIATLILQRSSFSFRKLLSLEGYLSQNRDQYFSAIERTLGTQYSHGYDATPWLEFFTLALGQHVHQFVAGLTDWHLKMQDVYSDAAEKGWSARQADGLVFTFQAGKITRADYIEITGVSPITASRDLAEMVGAGILEPVGKTRARVYYPVSEESVPVGGPAAEQLPLLSQ